MRIVSSCGGGAILGTTIEFVLNVSFKATDYFYMSAIQTYETRRSRYAVR